MGKHSLWLSLVIVGWQQAAVAAEGQRAVPAELSPWTMFANADWVVKAIMIGLAISALAAWIILIAKKIELKRMQHSLKTGLLQIQDASTLARACRMQIDNRICLTLMDAAVDEINHLPQRSKDEGVKERISLRLNRIEAAAIREASRSIGILASIGSTAPFVGLLGTVWGIMNSFIGISKTQTTNLVVVAPGIAEALLATAIGLVAAIPAVLFYNHLTRAVSAYRSDVHDAVAVVSVLSGREMGGVQNARIAAE